MPLVVCPVDPATRDENQEIPVHANFRRSSAVNDSVQNVPSCSHQRKRPRPTTATTAIRPLPRLLSVPVGEETVPRVWSKLSRSFQVLGCELESTTLNKKGPFEKQTIGLSMPCGLMEANHEHRDCG